jgi:hypothetical protein
MTREGRAASGACGAVGVAQAAIARNLLEVSPALAEFRIPPGLFDSVALTALKFFVHSLEGQDQ